MDIDWTARGLAAFSAVMALFSFGWAVLSWRLNGPALRVHCVVDQYTLTIRIFNRGRGGETVEHVILGGTRRGSGGYDLSQALALPATVPPGEARQWRVRLSTLPEARVRRLRSGWEITRLLCGSMRVLRAEVVPFDDPSQVGAWLLVPRRARYTRYLPPLGALCAWLSATPGDVADAAIVVLVFGSGVMVIGATMSSAPLTNRGKWVIFAWLFMAASGAWLVDDLDGPPAELSTFDNAVLVAVGVVAVAFAIPGFLAELISWWRPREWQRNLRRGHSRRKARRVERRQSKMPTEQPSQTAVTTQRTLDTPDIPDAPDAPARSVPSV